LWRGQGVCFVHRNVMKPAVQEQQSASHPEGRRALLSPCLQQAVQSRLAYVRALKAASRELEAEVLSSYWGLPGAEVQRHD
jgi:hypothetical protein